MTRLVLVAGAALLAACSLVVGDIDLPPEELVGVDQGGMRRDAQTDAAPGGSTTDATPPPADTAPPLTDAPGTAPPDADSAPPPDSTTPPEDAGPPPGDVKLPGDALVPPDAPVAPPPDLSAVQGYWYLHGFAQTQGDPTQLRAFSGALRIENDRTTLFGERGQIVDEVELRPHPDAWGRWHLRLPDVDTILLGAFAPATGFAAFASESADAGTPPALVLLVRANEDSPAALPELAAYARVGRAPEAGDAEVGSLRHADTDIWVQEGRYPAEPLEGLLPERRLIVRGLDPWRSEMLEPESDTRFEAVPTPFSAGVVAVERRPVEGGTGLLLGWVGQGPDPAPRPGELLCAGLRYDRRRGESSGFALAAGIDGAPSIQWEGGLAQRISSLQGIYMLGEGLNPFLLNQSVAFTDAADEVLVVLPLDPQASQAVWGLMACVRTDLLPHSM